MSRTLEQKIEINGAIGSSFLDAFRKANQGMSDFQKEAKAIQRELSRLNNDFRSGRLHESQYIDETQKLGTELNSLERELKDAAAAQKRFADETALAKRRLDEQAAAARKRNETLKTDLQTGLSNAGNRVKTGATMAAVGGTAIAAATAVDSLNTAADFEAQISKIAAKSNASQTELEALRQTALELGAATSLSASQTAVAMDGLAAGGMNVNQIMSAMPGIIAGAEASGEDLTLVSNTVSSALSIWGMQASEASRVADVLAETANRSSASVEDMSYAFKYAGAPAASLGKSLEETSSAIAVITNNGIDGSTAGTALRSGLLALNNPVKSSQKLMDKYGISLRDADNELISMSGIVSELQKSLEGLSEAEQTAVLGELVGTEAVSSFLALIRTGPDALDEMTTALENSAGASEKAAKVMKDNYNGAKEQMLGAAETAQIAFATPLLPVMQDVMTGIGSIIENNIDEIEAFGGAIANVISDITAPIAMQEPIKPEIHPNMPKEDAQALMQKYTEDMKQYELFQDMDGGEKITYMLDEATNAITDWLEGSGGEAMQDVFMELGTIAGKAWMGGLTNSATGAVEALMDGNVAGALAMGATANAMTGGLLMSGGLAGGKWLAGKGMDKYKASKEAKADKAAASTATSTTASKANPKAIVGPMPATKSTQLAQRPVAAVPSTAAAQPSVAQTGAKAAAKGFGKKVLSGAGRFALPVAAAAGVIEIVTSDNKAEATGKTVGGLAGGLGGAKAGALIGTAIAPGIGTAIGGALGGIIGGIGGSLLGSKAGNAIAGPAPQNNTAVAQQPPANVTAANTQLETNILAMSTLYQTETMNLQLSFTTLQTQTTTLNTTLTNMNMQLGQATGWIASLQQIQPAVTRVISALGALEQRINAVELPGSASARRTAYE